jgi:hypothetical protein
MPVVLHVVIQAKLVVEGGPWNRPAGASNELKLLENPGLIPSPDEGSRMLAELVEEENGDGARRRLGEPASGLNQLFLASACLWSRSTMLGYENLLSVLLARVAGYGHDLVALLGFCHDISLT